MQGDHSVTDVSLLLQEVALITQLWHDLQPLGAQGLSCMCVSSPGLDSKKSIDNYSMEIPLFKGFV